jgi:hypothetical protein
VKAGESVSRGLSLWKNERERGERERERENCPPLPVRYRKKVLSASHIEALTKTEPCQCLTLAFQPSGCEI